MVMSYEKFWRKKKDRNLGIHYIYEKPGEKKTKILQYTTLTERQVR